VGGPLGADVHPRRAAQGRPLGVVLVVYGYIAYTFGRYPSAMQKIAGTGLVTPAFS
jgi:hypothetical protein